MKETKFHLRLLSNSFDKIHVALSNMRDHVEEMDSPDARKVFDEFEMTVLSLMLKFRRTLDIPYDWHDRKPEREDPEIDPPDDENLWAA